MLIKQVVKPQKENKKMMLDLIKEQIKECRKVMKDCESKGKYCDFEIELDFLKTELNEYGYGECEKCFKIEKIDRGCNFIYNTKENEEWCMDCYTLAVSEGKKEDFE